MIPAPIEREDLLLLHVFLSNVEVHLDCKEDRSPEICLEAILSRFKGLQRLGIIERIDKLVIGPWPTDSGAWDEEGKLRYRSDTTGAGGWPV